jgi:integrase
MAIIAAQRRQFRSWWCLTQYAQNGYWYITGTPPGQRQVRKSTRQRDWNAAFDEAEKIAHAIDAKRDRIEHLRAAGLDPAKDAVNDITLKQALIDYMGERGSKCPEGSQVNMRGYNRVLLTFFEDGLMLSGIGNPQVTKVAAWYEQGGMIDIDPKHYKRKPGPYGVNGFLRHLRAVMNYAKRRWHCIVQDVQWNYDKGSPGVFRNEPPPPTRIVHEGEEEADLRDGLDLTDGALAPVFEFALLTSVRKENVMTLKKRQVDWRAREITFIQKGNRNHVVFITPKIESILRAEWDNHAEYVFTYIARRNLPRYGIKKGERYPYSEGTISRRWSDAKVSAGIAHKLTFHDSTRRTRITRIIRKTGNPKLAQRVAGHADLNTTMRYNVVTDHDVREAMTAMEREEGAVVPLKARRKAKLRVAK